MHHAIRKNCQRTYEISLDAHTARALASDPGLYSLDDPCTDSSTPVLTLDCTCPKVCPHPLETEPLSIAFPFPLVEGGGGASLPQNSQPHYRHQRAGHLC
eukprot:3475586-Pleurochrysis_carterae.AAC.1